MLGNLLAAKGPNTIWELWMEQNVPAVGSQPSAPAPAGMKANPATSWLRQRNLEMGTQEASICGLQCLSTTLRGESFRKCPVSIKAHQLTAMAEHSLATKVVLKGIKAACLCQQPPFFC